MKVIITGTTGMVGEGVLRTCLKDQTISQILSISRKPCGISDPKLSELLLPDFSQIGSHAEELSGYDGCFFCSGVSSVGMEKEKYRKLTYDLTMDFASALHKINPQMTFCYVSGAGTSSGENSRLDWANVKGKTENDLLNIGFKAVYNYRPGVMLPAEGQEKWRTSYLWIGKIWKFFAPKSVLKIETVGKSMIEVTRSGYVDSVLEISDIRKSVGN